jgi:hypothetical protein
MDPRMSFKLLADETLTEAWERYHGFMIDLPTADMEDWEFNQGFYYGLSQEAKEHIDALIGGTFFMLNIEKAQALFEKLSASKRESETRKFQGMALTQPAASETQQAEQEILAQPSNGKRMPMSWIRLSGPALPIVPYILGQFKVHHALYDWRASMNILPQMVYDCLDEDPLVPTPHQLQLADSVMMQPYGIGNDVLIEF